CRRIRGGIALSYLEAVVVELVAGGVEECCADSSSSMIGRDQETHYGSDGLVRICYRNSVGAHVCEVGSGLSVAPAYRFIVNIGQEALGSAVAYQLGPCGSMLGPSLCRRVPVVSWSIVEAAVAACPVGEIGEGLVEELQIA